MKKKPLTKTEQEKKDSRWFADYRAVALDVVRILNLDSYPPEFIDKVAWCARDTANRFNLRYPFAERDLRYMAENVVHRYNLPASVERKALDVGEARAVAKAHWNNGSRRRLGIGLREPDDS